MYDLVLAKNKIGSFYLPNIDSDWIVKAIKKGQVYDEPIISMFEKYTNIESDAIDLGANFGQMSVALSKLCKTVYSVEADPYITGILHKNIAINSAWNCQVLSVAAWDKTGELLPYPEPDLNKFESLGSFGIVPSSDSKRVIHSLALDDLHLENVSFIKIDIQGSDLKAMQGLTKTIKKCKPVILFEYEHIFDKDFSTNSNEYNTFIASIDYKIEAICDNNFLIVPK
jgi:FkbM family methyltransferase